MCVPLAAETSYEGARHGQEDSSGFGDHPWIVRSLSDGRYTTFGVACKWPIMFISSFPGDSKAPR